MPDKPESDSDLRRRAAWLLAMLAVVAVLFVVVLTTLLDSSGGGNDNGSGPDDTLVTAPSSGSSSAPADRSSTATDPGATSSSPPGASSSPATKTCPTDQTCALEGDYGQAIAAINHYRESNGQKRLPGTVSKQAQECAKNNGSGCSGGWAESQVPSLDGDMAVKKVAKLGKLLDPGMKSFAVGWAYSPRSKQYFFAIVRVG